MGKDTKFKPRELHINWNGGKFINKAGYVYFLCPNHPRANKQGYVLEHILVMEKKIGRYILHPEQIHHINGNKSDNRLSNLRLYENVSIHRKAERHGYMYIDYNPLVLLESI